MMVKLRDKIAEYVKNNSDLTNWEETRQNYAYYSYMAFLCLAAHDLDCNCDSNILYDTVTEYGLENPDIINFMKTVPDIEKFAEEIFKIAVKTESVDVNSLYQEYLSKDFFCDGKKIVFTGIPSFSTLRSIFLNPFLILICPYCFKSYFILWVLS